MRYWVWSEIRAKIEKECDLEDEVFVSPDELLEYVNEAIDEAEAEIHSLYEDYFLKKATIPVISGDEFFLIPTYLPDIYANKIRSIIFTLNGGTTTYKVDRIKDWKKFEDKALADTNLTTDLYRYFLVNQTAGNPQIMLVPVSRETGTLTVWYLRNANKLSLDTDVCDIPEFINFVFAHMRMKVFGKEGHPSYNEALERLETERSRMNAVLSTSVPDSDNEIELDMGFYRDMN